MRRLETAVVLPARFSGPFISRTFFPKWYRSKMLSAVNRGRCYDWAYYAYCLFPQVKLWTTDWHAWVQVGSRFFDSEAGQGKKNIVELPSNSRTETFWDEVEPRETSVDEFKDLWNSIGAGRTHHWNTMLQEIASKGLKPIRS